MVADDGDAHRARTPAGVFGSAHPDSARHELVVAPFFRTSAPCVANKPPLEKPCPVSAERVDRALAAAGFLSWIFDFFEGPASAHWWATARPGLYPWRQFGVGADLNIVC